MAISTSAGDVNCYATLDGLKAKLNMSGTGDDADLLEVLKGCSRAVEHDAGRVFWVEDGDRYFDVHGAAHIHLDDCLAVSAVGADSEGDGTYDGEAWVEGTDYYLGPANRWPKWRLERTRFGDKWARWKCGRYLKVTGTWGYGNGKGSSPWAGAGVTGTVGDGTGTTLVVSAGSVVEAGQTLKLGDEQLFVEGVDGTGLQVVRGVNGTVGVAQSGVAVSVAQYPSDVVRTCLWYAVEAWGSFQGAGLESERIGDYSYKRVGVAFSDAQRGRMLGRVTRVAI